MPAPTTRFPAMARSLRILVGASAAFLALAAPGASAQDDAAGLARAWLRDRGMAEGADPAAGRWAVVVAGPVGCPVDGIDYPAARTAAFDRLFTEGKRRFAEYLGAEVRAARSGSSSLSSICGDPGAVGALASGGEEWLKTTEFDRVAEVAMEASVAGLLPCQTFESVAGREATVAAVLLADPRLRPGAPAPASARPVAAPAWFESLDDAVLCRTFGIRPVVGTGGTFEFVAFGQSPVLESGGQNDACDLAEQSAREVLRAAVRDRLAATVFSAASSRFRKGSAVPEEWRSTSELRRSVEQDLSATFRGESQVGRRFALDPASGRRLCVVAVSLRGTAGQAVTGAPGSGCPPVPPNMAGSVRPIVGEGSGPDRDAALKAALLDAIGQDGTRVEGSSALKRQYQEAVRRCGDEVERMVSSSTARDSTTTTFASGFIHSYAVLSQSGEAPMVRVQVCANVVRFDPKDPRFGLPPTLAVLDVSVGSARVGGQPVPAAPFSDLAEGILDQAMLEGGRFQLIAERDLQELARVRSQISSRAESGQVDEVELMKLGRSLTADYVLIGRIEAVEFLGPPGQRPAGIEASHAASASLDVRIVNVADGSVLCRGSFPVVLKGRDIVLVRAGREVQHPDEPSLSPAQLAVARAARAAAAALTECSARTLPGGERLPPPASAPSVARVGAQEVTLDVTRCPVRPGARFAVVNLVDVRLADGRVLQDRDRVALLEVTSARDGLAKAKVIEGDIDLITAESLLEPAK